jgi:hypothetical protein
MGTFLRLALLAILIYAAYRWVRRATALGRPDAPTPRQSTPRAVEDLTLCPTCRTYTAAGSPACARPDCPKR